MQILKELFLYSIGGGSSFLLNLTLTYLLTEKFKIYYLISAISGYITSLVFNFYFQSLITFKSREKYFKKFIKFATIQITGLIIYSLLVYLLTDVFKSHYLNSVVLSSIIVLFYNFSFVKIFIFQKNSKFL